MSDAVQMAVALAVMALAAGVLAELVRRGCFRWRAMADGPDRLAALERAWAGARHRGLPVVIAVPVALGLVPRAFRIEARDALMALLAAVPVTMGVSVATTTLAELAGDPLPDAIGHELLRQMLDAEPQALIHMLIAALVVAPVIEELIFRGLIQSLAVALLGVVWRWPVVLLSAVLFAMVHVAVAWLGNAEAAVTWHALPALAALGVILGWVYEKTGSLWPAMLIHAGFNAWNIGMAFALQALGWVESAGV